MTFDELNVVRVLKSKIQTEKNYLLALRDCAESMTGEIDGLPKGNFATPKIESLTAAIIESEGKLTALQTELNLAIPALINKIQSEIKNEQIQKLLIYRFVMCKYFREIARLMCYSERRIYQMYKNTLKKFQSISVDFS